MSVAKILAILAIILSSVSVALSAFVLVRILRKGGENANS